MLLDGIQPLSKAATLEIQLLALKGSVLSSCSALTEPPAVRQLKGAVLAGLEEMTNLYIFS